MKISQKNMQDLARQYSEWKGYQVQTALIIGPAKDGVHDYELGLIAFHAEQNHVAQIEILISDQPWGEQKVWFNERFDLGRTYIFTEVFPELTWRTELFQIAILAESPTEQILGAKVFTADELIRKIRHEIDYDAATGGLGDNFERFELLGFLRRH